MHAEHEGHEGENRRQFFRVDYEAIVNLRELKGEKLSSKADITTRNISACGILFRTEKIPPALSSITWVALDPKMMSVCSEIEDDLLIHNGGIFGRVVRIAEGEPGKSYDVGIAFLRKKSMTQEEIEQLMSEK
ncbi:MAG: PilZ domain-containing protein [Candidatus Omnitrophota bacterium]